MRCDSNEQGRIFASLPASSNQPYPTAVNKALWKWVDGVVSPLPARCVRACWETSTQKCEKKQLEMDCSRFQTILTLGPATRRFRTRMVSSFTFLHTHYMSAVNTFHSVGPTYCGIAAGYTSCVDYTCLPTSLLGSVQKCCIWHAGGDELQLVAAPGKRDHRPVQVVLDHSLLSPQSPTAQNGIGTQTSSCAGLCRGKIGSHLCVQLKPVAKHFLQSSAWN